MIDTRMCSTCGFTAYIDDCWCDREQCEHTEWVPEIESWVRCTANTLMHTPDTRVLCPAHCGCGMTDQPSLFTQLREDPELAQPNST